MLRYLALAAVLAVTATACGDKKKAEGAASKERKADDDATDKLLEQQQRKNADKPAAPGEPK